MNSSAGGPSATGTSPTAGPAVTPGGGQKKLAFQGPCYLKMLVSNLVAGSIIGKSGAVIGSIENSTGTSMKLSPTSSFFPGTNDRIVVMSGEQEQVNRAMAVILEKIGEVTAAQYAPDVREPQVGRCELNCKIVVPKSAVSGIIGKAGQQIKQLQEESGAKVQISNREQGLNERVVSITGTLENIHMAAVQISTVIQEDANLKDHMYVVYNPPHAGGGGGMYGAAAMGFAGYGQFMGSAGGAGSYPYGAPFPTASQGGSPTTQPSANELEHLMMDHCEIVMEIPDSCMGPVIGKAGVHLTDIMRTTGASIKLSQKGDFVPGTQNRKVTISGTVSSVHRAHARLLLRLKETGSNSAAPRFSPPMSGGGPFGGSGAGGQMGGAGHGVHSSQGAPPAQHAGGYGQYGIHAQYGQLPSYQQQYTPY